MAIKGGGAIGQMGRGRGRGATVPAWMSHPEGIPGGLQQGRGGDRGGGDRRGGRRYGKVKGAQKHFDGKKATSEASYKDDTKAR